MRSRSAVRLLLIFSLLVGLSLSASGSTSNYGGPWYHGSCAYTGNHHKHTISKYHVQTIEISGCTWIQYAFDYERDGEPWYFAGPKNYGSSTGLEFWFVTGHDTSDHRAHGTSTDGWNYLS